MELNRILQGDCLSVLKAFPKESVDMVITSPPYWALRDYGVAGQIGLERTFHEYVKKLCDVFDEVQRVLKSGGTCWVNMGDTYSTQSGAMRDGKFGPKQTNNQSFIQPKTELPDKCLLQIPSRFAIEMCNRGWILRNEIVWHKPNCMPHSVKDRFTVDFEKIFFFVKSKKYYFEQQLESADADENLYRQKLRNKKTYNLKYEGYKNNFPIPRLDGKRNKRSVWSITTKPFKGAHFATFPEALIETPIKAGCPEMICQKCGAPRVKLFKRIELGRTESATRYDTKNSTAGRLAQKRQAYRELGFENPPAPEFVGYSDCGCGAEFKPGIVLDPFMGAGTTAVVARKFGRGYLGVELNPEYITIAERRLNDVQLSLVK